MMTDVARRMKISIPLEVVGDLLQESGLGSGYKYGLPVVVAIAGIMNDFMYDLADAAVCVKQELALPLAKGEDPGRITTRDVSQAMVADAHFYQRFVVNNPMASRLLHHNKDASTIPEGERKEKRRGATRASKTKAQEKLMETKAEEEGDDLADLDVDLDQEEADEDYETEEEDDEDEEEDEEEDDSEMRPKSIKC